jgi:hypothetical protein
MTAIEWLVQQIDNKDMGEIPMWIYDLCYDALEMEKQQIIDSYERGWDMGALDIDCNSEKYYSETYKSNNP